MAFNRMENRVAIITGGSRGIGEACCELFAEEGAKVVIADIDDANGNALLDKIKATGAEAIFVHSDVGSEADIATMTRATLDAFGTIDVLVNNAGVELFKNALETSTDEWERCINVDLRGVFLCTKYALPTMLDKGKGAVVNISSVHAVQTIQGITAYAAAKGGVAAMTRNMALDHAPAVRVNTIFPGFIATTIWDRFLAAAPDPSKLEADIMALQPMKRLGTSRDIAQSALFLASDEASWITGATLYVDGGITARLYN
jgi:NAD(P)-dependent dehydrogenase (short-subunit alcohol dehydrogenase family)